MVLETGMGNYVPKVKSLEATEDNRGPRRSTTHLVRRISGKKTTAVKQIGIIIKTEKSVSSSVIHWTSASLHATTIGISYIFVNHS